MMKTLATAVIAIAAFAGPAQAQSARDEAGPTPGPRSGERSDIPFSANRGVRTFTPENQGRGVYIEDTGRNWYYASFFMRCQDLPYGVAYGFSTFSGSTLSRGDSIIAGGERCRIADIVRSGPPPEKPRKQRRAGAT